MKRAWLAAALAVLLLLSGCGHTLRNNGSDSYGGVTASLSPIESRVEGEYKVVYLDGTITFSNQSAEDVMEIDYLITILDRNGTVLYEVGRDWIGEDTPLAAGGSTTVPMHFQHSLDGTADHLDIQILDIQTVEELPPVHVPQTGEYLYQALPDAGLEAIGDTLPTAAHISINRGGEVHMNDVTDPETIQRLVEAFCSVTIGQEDNTYATESDSSLYFTFPDGTSAGISLNTTNLEVDLNGNWHTYTLDNFDPLWSLMQELANEGQVEYIGGS